MPIFLWKFRSSPTRPKASHQVGSRTEGRSLKGDVRSRGEARNQAASLNSEEAVVTTHSTAGPELTSVRTRGEPRPKEPTIKPGGGGKAKPGMTSALGKGRRDFEPANCLDETGAECQRIRVQEPAPGWAAPVMSPCGVVTRKVTGPNGPLLTNRMTYVVNEIMWCSGSN